MTVWAFGDEAVEPEIVEENCHPMPDSLFATEGDAWSALLKTTRRESNDAQQVFDAFKYKHKKTRMRSKEVCRRHTIYAKALGEPDK